ncbi:hypothetical protein DOTSEDRAFT_142882 [Dothistroma septosporum NZE10]|uniref:Uncharacterized protein n=1 Tax=Dothistroma septosporum (strain NZE10 / CBS 128990) TaxID=675120 RepID=N1Q1P3_DOTSN|nr:hypothetical protein DOTSEDRAFT_142882 [Dothistroma septosporum NZE10]
MQKQKELLSFAIRAAGKAKQDLSNGVNDPDSRSRRLLDSYFQCLRLRFEAARNFEEVLREQMYHVKSLISDVNKMEETLEAMQSIKQEFSASPRSILEEESFDMEKATEQVYFAFYTMVRKAEEIDDRLDEIAEREREADELEQGLDEREEELDSWENDLQAREKAMADREDRLARSRQRLKRCRPDRPNAQQAPKEFDKEESWEGEWARALPWHQDSPPRDLVGSWLRQNAIMAESVIHGRSPLSTVDD